MSKDLNDFGAIQAFLDIFDKEDIKVKIEDEPEEEELKKTSNEEERIFMDRVQEEVERQQLKQIIGRIPLTSEKVSEDDKGARSKLYSNPAHPAPNSGIFNSAFRKNSNVVHLYRDRQDHIYVNGIELGFQKQFVSDQRPGELYWVRPNCDFPEVNERVLLNLIEDKGKNFRFPEEGLSSETTGFVVIDTSKGKIEQGKHHTRNTGWILLQRI